MIIDKQFLPELTAKILPYTPGESIEQNEPRSYDGGLYVALLDITSAPNPFDPAQWELLASGTNDHNLLINRDLVDQHPMSAIIGLESNINSLQADITENTSDITAHTSNTEIHVSTDDRTNLENNTAQVAALTDDFETLRADVDALEGGVIPIGLIDESNETLVAAGGQDLLNSRATEIKGDVLKGYSLVDNDMHEWVFNGTEWADTGIYNVTPATNTSLGVVKGTTDNLGVGINPDSTMGVNGLSNALSTKAPTYHASSATTYGLASDSSYGHVRPAGEAVIYGKSAFIAVDRITAVASSVINSLGIQRDYVVYGLTDADNLPPDPEMLSNAGFLSERLTFGNNFYRIQIFYPRGSQKIWMRTEISSSNTWNPWVRIDGGDKASIEYVDNLVGAINSALTARLAGN